MRVGLSVGADRVGVEWTWQGTSSSGSSAEDMFLRVVPADPSASRRRAVVETIYAGLVSDSYEDGIEFVAGDHFVPVHTADNGQVRGSAAMSGEAFRVHRSACVLHDRGVPC